MQIRHTDSNRVFRHSTNTTGCQKIQELQGGLLNDISRYFCPLIIPRHRNQFFVVGAFPSNERRGQSPRTVLHEIEPETRLYGHDQGRQIAPE